MSRHAPDPAAVELLLGWLAGRREALDAARQPAAVWSDAIDLAVAHEVAPLLYRRAKAGDIRGRVEPAQWKRLRLLYLQSAARNVRLFHELAPVLRRLRDAGIRVVALKGAYLAEAVYGDVALRPMSDVDIMVPAAEFSNAGSILLDRGVTRRPYEERASPLRRSLTLYLPMGVHVDLAASFDVPAGPHRLDLDGLWARARPATIAGTDVLALSPEDLLLHLCLHASFRHGFQLGLRPLCDIAETVGHFGSELDWTRFAARAREWDAARYVALTLSLARSLLAAPLPDEVDEKLVPGGIDRSIVSAAAESAIARTTCGTPESLFRKRGARTLGDRLKLPFERVFVSRGELAMTYPASLGSRHGWFYYVLRLRDVVRTYWWFRAYQRVEARGRGRNAAKLAAVEAWLREGRQEENR